MSETHTETAAAVEAGQNPVMNFIGNYQSDRCTMLLEAYGSTDAKVKAHWGNDATSATEWELTGTFDETSMCITYTNAVKKIVTYANTGALIGESVVYQNGSGYIRINDDNTLTWHDNNDPSMDSKTFTYIPTQQDIVSEQIPQEQQTLPTTITAPTAAAATTTTKAATTTTKPSTTAAKETTAATTQPTTADDGQNPVMNFVGPYQSGRCRLTIMPSGKNGATITASWGDSAFSAAQWSMSADFDPDTMRMHYGDCTKTLVTYDENGNVTQESVEYTNGFGRLQFFGDGTLRWENENEPDLFTGMTFNFVG